MTGTLFVDSALWQILFLYMSFTTNTVCAIFCLCYHYNANKILRQEITVTVLLYYFRANKIFQRIGLRYSPVILLSEDNDKFRAKISLKNDV